MELDNVAEFLRNKTILITGATGFLAKVFVEKILRTQPSVNKLYLLIRASDAKSATERLYNEIIQKELFWVLRDDWGSQFGLFISRKVITVPGDMCFYDLGVSDSKLREEMLKEIDIVVNLAANTNFFGRYDASLAINTFGTLNLLSFAKKCDKMKLFLHTSTAYVCGEQAGIIQEKPFYMGETLKKQTCKLDINEEKRIVQEKLEELQFQGVINEDIDSAMTEIGFQRAKLYGWPNTYVFTKAMGEMLLGECKGDFPLVIVRPTMIASTINDPFPGWIEGVKAIDGLIVTYAKRKVTCVPANPNTIVDVIPADMVVNAMIVAMTIHLNQQSCNTIYHISSSLQNPLTIRRLSGFLYSYFAKIPLVDRNGKSIKVGKPKFFSSANKFRLYMKIKYMVPLKVLLWLSVLCQCLRKLHKNLDHKIKLAMRVAETYIPFLNFNGIFDDTNLGKLQQMARERGIDQSVFNFDSKSIDWQDYIMNRHIPGLKEHVIKP